MFCVGFLSVAGAAELRLSANKSHQLTQPKIYKHLNTKPWTGEGGNMFRFVCGVIVNANVARFWCDLILKRSISSARAIDTIRFFRIRAMKYVFFWDVWLMIFFRVFFYFSFFGDFFLQFCICREIFEK